MTEKASCCGSSASSADGLLSMMQPIADAPWIRGRRATPSGEVPVIDGIMTSDDNLGRLRVRLGLNRDSYAVQPGLYALGDPDADSPVVVTANYKLTFDLLRRALRQRSVWLLVVDTRGINVWCAAGKGTFSAKEVSLRVILSGLASVVTHRRLILPQLAASGVDAAAVQKATGFRVHFGPVQAEDLPAYLDANLVATSDMRRVDFPAWDRLVLTPVELVHVLPKLLIALLLIFLVAGLSGDGFDPVRSLHEGLLPAVASVWSALLGTVLTPLLLPWLPGRAFAFKGWFLGLVGMLPFALLSWAEPLAGLALLLIFPPVSAFLAMNFTGCSTFTSPSGVKVEMRRYLPLIGVSLLLGFVLAGILAWR